MKSFLCTLLIGFSTLYSLQAQGQKFAMHDLHHAPLSSNFNSAVEYNGKLFFAADDGLHGTELWMYDGINPASMVADVALGAQDFSPSELVVFQGKLYFIADDVASGTEIWSYDENNGIALATDILPNDGYTSIASLTPYDGKLFFFAGYPTADIWQFDGTNPPSLVVDRNDITTHPREMKVFNDKLYFTDEYNNAGHELWVYDGNNHSLVASLNNGLGGGAPQYLHVFQNKLYYAFSDNSSNSLDREVWVYDGVNTPSQLSDINPGNGTSIFSNLVAPFITFNNKLYITASDGTVGAELFVYDGNNPPALVADIKLNGSSTPKSLTVFQNQLYFTADDGIVGRELWKYDGSTTPELVIDLSPETTIDGVNSSLVSYNNQLYFGGDNGFVGREMMRYDGTNPPELVQDINKNNQGSSPTEFTEFNGELYFVTEQNFKSILYQYRNNDTPIAIDTFPRIYDLTVFNNKLYFLQTEGDNEQELWVYDGSNPPAMEVIIRDEPSFSGSVFYDIFPLNGKLYYGGWEATSGYELWAYDGSNPATIIYDANTLEDAYPLEFTSFDGALYYSCNDGINGYELWKYDGSNIPTMVADINTGNSSSAPQALRVFDGKLYFFTRDNVNNRALHSYDGNSIALVANLSSLTTVTSLSPLEEYEGALYFSIRNSAVNQTLWKYDGSNTPSMVMELATNYQTNTPIDFTVHNGLLYLTKFGNNLGQELWAYDGVKPATMVTNLNAGNRSSNPQDLFSYNDLLVFSADDRYHGRELWEMSDSCAAASSCCFASFYHVPDTSGQYTVSIWDNSEGENLSYLWDFGDGNTSTMPLPTHTYATTGTYKLCLTVTNAAATCSDTYCDEITIYSNPLSIEIIPAPIISAATTIDEDLSLDLLLFPNPTEDRLFLHPSFEGNYVVKVYDLAGGLLLEKHNPVEISTKGLAAGLYLLKVETEKGALVRKFVRR